MIVGTMILLSCHGGMKALLCLNKGVVQTIADGSFFPATENKSEFLEAFLMKKQNRSGH